jgi:hypothetical protein
LHMAIGLYLHTCLLSRNYVRAAVVAPRALPFSLLCVQEERTLPAYRLRSSGRNRTLRRR